MCRHGGMELYTKMHNVAKVGQNIKGTGREPDHVTIHEWFPSSQGFPARHSVGTQGLTMMRSVAPVTRGKRRGAAERG